MRRSAPLCPDAHAVVATADEPLALCPEPHARVHALQMALLQFAHRLLRRGDAVLVREPRVVLALVLVIHRLQARQKLVEVREPALVVLVAPRILRVLEQTQVALRLRRQVPVERLVHQRKGVAAPKQRAGGGQSRRPVAIPAGVRAETRNVELHLSVAALRPEQRVDSGGAVLESVSATTKNLLNTHRIDQGVERNRVHVATAGRRLARRHLQISTDEQPKQCSLKFLVVVLTLEFELMGARP
mmetsp:Transcript_14946/g.37237  ORF Transcript_14946/g.37237 Transcript_14946/m.37237 type:complete len:244 (+) Transcript_14946:1366-2097(+)